LGTFLRSAVQHGDHSRQSFIPLFEIRPGHSDVSVTDKVEGKLDVSRQLEHIAGHTTPEAVHATIRIVPDAGSFLSKGQRPREGENRVPGRLGRSCNR